MEPTPSPQALVDRVEQLLLMVGLLDEINRAFVDGIHGHGDITMSADEDDRDARTSRAVQRWRADASRPHGGQIPSGIESLTNLIELHRAGKVRILAVSGAGRSPSAPSIPTFREQGLTNNDALGWVGDFAPARTPKAVVDHLSAAIVEALRTPSIRDRYLSLVVEPTGTTPEELASIMAGDTARWAPIIKASGFTAD